MSCFSRVALANIVQRISIMLSPKKIAKKTENATECKHCGEPCIDVILDQENQAFCCLGCKTVYQLLQENELSCFYDINEKAGLSQKSKSSQNFNFLDDQEFTNSLLTYQNEELAKVTFSIPAMHCAACIWLLEKLYKFHTAIEASRVNFNRKTVTITYKKQEIKLKELVVLLDKLGYTPDIQLENKTEQQSPYRKIWMQIGIAGFAFGNAMLFSLPEYFGLDIFDGSMVSKLFPILNAILALPVLLYSAQDYLKSAWNATKTQRINMDVPISLGIITLFAYSYYLIFFEQKLGYIDSFTGLIFFLLLGKYYQQKTFDHLKFDREVKSFFPLSVTKLTGKKEQQVLLKHVLPDDTLRIRNEEIIPADCLLLSDGASIDYSFVTGESILEEKQKEDLLYAGGRLKGASILVQVKNRPSQSHLAQLWDDEGFGKSRSHMQSLADDISKYFTFTILAIAIIAATYWLVQHEYSTAIKVFSTVLIVACPCALALATPVTLGNAMRALGKYGFFTKNTQTIESLAKIDTIVFDKTGTLTYPDKALVNFVGELPDHKLLAAISTLLNQSRHPLSQLIYNWLPFYPAQDINSFKETAGQGLSAVSNGYTIKLGKRAFVSDQLVGDDNSYGALVYLSIDDDVYGYFKVKHVFRNGIPELFEEINLSYETHLISGDNSNDLKEVQNWIATDHIQFHQLPGRKKHYVEALAQDGKSVLMVGDGLNDAGALKASLVGLAVTESSSQFSPASDAITLGKSLQSLPEVLKFSKKSISVIKLAFLISFCYNLIGIGMAVQGLLSPVFAAILMPISSITVVAIGMLGIKINQKIFNSKPLPE